MSAPATSRGRVSVPPPLPPHVPPSARLPAAATETPAALTGRPRWEEYVLNHCTKFLARDTTDPRHAFVGVPVDEPRAAIADPWRFPIVDSAPGAPNDNDVTFVWAVPRQAPQPRSVLLVSTCGDLYEPVPLQRVGDTLYWARTLRVPRGRRHRYRFLVDDVARLDPVNPQRETLATGDAWSSFFTWGYTQPVVLERWEYAILDRLTRHILPFNSQEARIYLQRSATDAHGENLYRLDVSVGAVNFIDKILAREERHRVYAYKTCLELIDTVLRRRYPGRDPAFLDERAFMTLYAQLAQNAEPLFWDGWDPARYADPSHFLWLLRRHTFLGAFAHPKYGGNAAAAGWRYLEERFGFDWRPKYEPPLGTSAEYRG
ncbi:MAG: gluconate 2-dehydrogenase subunit 3 family protein [Acidobacteria bacterium]|nr:gluconate 2-dehydrogenase subunit 3 family protein [Acidobacteriota bacterium]